MFNSGFYSKWMKFPKLTDEHHCEILSAVGIETKKKVESLILAQETISSQVVGGRKVQINLHYKHRRVDAEIFPRRPERSLLTAEI